MMPGAAAEFLLEHTLTGIGTMSEFPRIVYIPIRACR